MSFEVWDNLLEDQNWIARQLGQVRQKDQEIVDREMGITAKKFLNNQSEFNLVKNINKKLRKT